MTGAIRWWETWALIAVVVLIVAVAVIFFGPTTGTVVYPGDCPSAAPSGFACI